MMMTDDQIKKTVYNRTVLYSGICFDTTDQIRKVQEFLCLLYKRGVILFNEEQLEFDFEEKGDKCT